MNALLRQRRTGSASRSLYDTEVQALRMDGRTVREAIVSPYRASRRRCARKSVVAASGGFQANIHWMREYWGDAADNFRIRGTPYAQGPRAEEPARSGRRVGRRSDAVPCRRHRRPRAEIRWRHLHPARLRAVQHRRQQRRRQRFYDEGEDVWPKRYAIWGRLVARSRARSPTPSSTASASSCSCRRCSRRSGPTRSGSWPASSELDPATLDATVRAYNAAVQPGRLRRQQAGWERTPRG